MIKNFDKFVSSYGKKLENDPNSYLFRFINELRDYSFENIKNPVIMNNQAVEKNLKELKLLSDELTKKYNFYYVYGRLKNLPNEVLNGPAPYGNNFKEYMLGLSTQLDGHQKLNYNGNLYHISDIIRDYNPEEFEESHKKAM